MILEKTTQESRTAVSGVSGHAPPCVNWSGTQVRSLGSGRILRQLGAFSAQMAAPKANLKEPQRHE